MPMFWRAGMKEEGKPLPLAFQYLISMCTAIPYRVSTGPEQGFPCVLFPNREKPVFITGIAANENRFFPVGKSTQGKPCFHYRDGFAVQN